MASPLYSRRTARPPLEVLNLPGMQSTSEETVTTVLLSNLHCSRYAPSFLLLCFFLTVCYSAVVFGPSRMRCQGSPQNRSQWMCPSSHRRSQFDTLSPSHPIQSKLRSTTLALISSLRPSMLHPHTPSSAALLGPCSAPSTRNTWNTVHSVSWSKFTSTLTSEAMVHPPLLMGPFTWSCLLEE